MKNVDYTAVSEITGYNVTHEQIQRMYTRYRFASGFCEGKDVLEVACGSGQGLGYLAKIAKRVIGGDYDENIIKIANQHYKGCVEVKKMDAHNLLFDDKSFDVVMLYEAIYYLEKPERFVNEARRLLRDGGILIICSANKDWSGFNPSPHSYKYFSVPELYDLLHGNNFNDISLYGDCPVRAGTVIDKVISVIKRVAVRFHVMPKTMKGKEFLKRVFMGKLVPLPPEIKDGMVEYTPPVQIHHDKPNIGYKVIYAVGSIKQCYE